MARREFPRTVKLAAWARCKGLCEAMLPDGSRCNAKLTIGKFRYDHRVPDQLGGEPTLENCVVQCVVCDAPKTARDQTVIAYAKKLEASHLGAKAPSRSKIATRPKVRTVSDRIAVPPPRSLYRSIAK